MSYIRQYHNLFKVVARNINTKDVLAPVKLTPTAQCRNQLANHRLVYREREGGFDVYYQLNPGAAEPVLGKIEKKTQFGFMMTLSDRGFFKQYEPGLTDEPHFCFDNLDKNAVIQYKDGACLSVGPLVTASDATKIHGSVFHEPVDLSNGSSKLIVKDRFKDEIVAEFKIDSGTGPGLVLVRVDLSDHGRGGYILATDSAGAVEKSIYIDDNLVQANPQGIVNIFIDKAQDEMPESGVEFVINFKPR